jgi:chaperonin GroEL
LATLILNKLKGVFNALAIKAPAFGDQRKAILEDLAILTGGTVISEERGDSFEEVSLDMLGSARKVIADKDDSTIIEGNGNPSEIEARAAQIKKQIESASSEYDKENLEKRLAALQGKVAVIRVGGATETEIEEKKFRVDDAVAATKAAVAEGIVPGGGVTLVELSKQVKAGEGRTPEAAGYELLKRALVEPFRHLMENSGLNAEAKLAKVIEAKPGYGFDVANPSDQPIDLKAEGIIDPAKVVKEAIQNAVSVAGTAMTMGGLIVDIPEEEKAPAMPPGGGMGMGM